MEFKYTEICDFDVVEEDFTSNLIKPVNPFKITLKSKEELVIKAQCPIEFLILTGFDGPFSMDRGEKKRIKIRPVESIQVSFRLLQDESKQIFQHQYTIK